MQSTNPSIVTFIPFGPEADAQQLQASLQNARAAASALAEDAQGDRSVARAWTEIAAHLDDMATRAGWADRISRGA